MALTLGRKPAVKLPAIDEKQNVDLLGLVELLQKHVTESLCREVFLQTRDKERQRKWSLHALVWFWMSVIIRAPKALTQALNESQQGGDALVPNVEATPEAFFEKCKDLRSDFFAELYDAVGPSFLAEAVPAFAQQAALLGKHFPEIWALDGSQLGEVAHRLKILWNLEATLLPGRLMVLYDVFRGINRAFCFEPDAAKNESLLARQALGFIPEGTLLVVDRLYGVPWFFQALSAKKLWGVARLNASVKVEVLKVLSRRQGGRALLEDLLVRIGAGKEKQIVRLIRYRAGKKRLDLFANVLDVEKLSAEQAVELYGLRWSIERMFFDLKEVLNLNRFYAGNPNAIAMQVYAAAIVYNAFRIIQGRIARTHGIAPEAISPQRLYPKIAAVACKLAIKEETCMEMMEANPGVKLVKPSWRKGRFGQTTLGSILVRKKDKPRTPKRHRVRSTWMSWRHVPGGAKLLEN